MNKNVLLIVGGAFVMALVVAMVVQSRLSGGSKAEASSEILVANKKLAIGQKVKPEDVRWQVWPDSAMFQGVIKRSEQEDEKTMKVYDTPLRRAVESGEPITQQAVIEDGKGGNNFVSATLAPGMRAVAIAVKPETSVGGFLAPGDYVDVIVSYAPRLSGDMQKHAEDIIQRNASQTVLTNVRVLAVDQESKTGEEREVKTAKTITLEVTKEGAEKLTLASDMGKLSLALRRLGEQDSADDLKPSLVTDSTISTVIQEVERSRQDNQTISNAVRMYNGTDIQNIPVRMPIRH
jgi:pilus assembly protein CpaB